MELWGGFDIPAYLILLPVLLILLYIYATWPYGELLRLGIPGPPPQPFFGNQRTLIKKGTFYTLMDWCKEYGRIYGIYMCRQPMLVIGDLDILKEILVKDFNRFSNRFVQNRAVISDEIRAGVFFAENPDWKRIRNIITPTFSAGKLKSMEHYINQCSSDLTDNIVAIAKRGDKLDVKEYFGAYTMDAITGTAFGMSVNSQQDLDEPFVTNMKKMFSRAGQFNFLLYLFMMFPWLQPIIKFLRARGINVSKSMQFLINSAYVLIDQRKAEKEEKRPTDFLQLLINAEASDGNESEGSEKRLSRVEIAGQLFLFYVAGYETTSTTLQYLAYVLARYPEVQDRVVREMETQLGQDKPTYDNVAKLKYMEQVINETLRLFPPVTMITRMASETVEINGLTIPKGFGVVIPICTVLRDPEFFPDPEKFDPDRFSNANKSDFNPLSFLPFGFGPRLCVGMRLALLEVKVAMVHVLRKVKFVNTPDLPQEIKFASAGGLLPPSSPIMVPMELRNGGKVASGSNLEE